MTHPTRLLILACSATKFPGPDSRNAIPALHRYDGPLWRTLRHVDRLGRLARATALSAEYGWIDSQQPIADYNRLMTEGRAAELRASPLADYWLREVGARPPYRAACICGGARYLTVMRHLVELATAAGIIAPDAPVETVNDSIGLMRRDLRDWLLA